MKNKKYRLGLSILAGGLSFVGAANATDLIVNGSFEVPGGGAYGAYYGAHCGGFSGNLVRAGASSCSGAIGWQSFGFYNFSYAYYSGPAIPASENPGNYYSLRQAAGWSEWEHFVTPMDPTTFLNGTMPSYAASETVMLTDAASASDIDAGLGQYSFSSWLASDGVDADYPEQPYLVLQFFSTPSGQPQPGDFISTAVIFDRCRSDYAVNMRTAPPAFRSTFPAIITGSNTSPQAPFPKGRVRQRSLSHAAPTRLQAARSMGATLVPKPTWIWLNWTSLARRLLLPASASPRPARPLPWATASVSPSRPPAVR